MPHEPDQAGIIKLQSLTDKEWEDIHSRVLLFARKRIGRRQFRVNPDPNDIANSAIEKTLSGCRPWNSLEFTIFEHLCGVIRSEISNLMTSHDNKLTSSLNCEAGAGAEIACEAEPSVEDICIERDMIGKFLDSLSKEAPHLREYARLRLVEGEHPKECAARLNIPVPESYKLSRQLKQRVADFGAAGVWSPEPRGALPPQRSRVNGRARDDEEERRAAAASFSGAVSCFSGAAPSGAVSWACGGEPSGAAIGDEAHAASGAFSFKCDGGHNNDN